MSEYKDFSKCIVCRSKNNLENYDREFEFTELLNTLYFAVMYACEKRIDMHVKSAKVAAHLRENKLVDECGNRFEPDQMVRYLRNSLAHFNMEVASDPYGNLETVCLWGINASNYAKCSQPCSQLRCIPEQFKEKEIQVSAGNVKAICIFKFSVEELHEFVAFIYELVIGNDTMCAECNLKKNPIDG